MSNKKLIEAAKAVIKGWDNWDIDGNATFPPLIERLEEALSEAEKIEQAIKEVDEYTERMVWEGDTTQEQPESAEEFLASPSKTDIDRFIDARPYPRLGLKRGSWARAVVAEMIDEYAKHYHQQNMKEVEGIITKLEDCKAILKETGTNKDQFDMQLLSTSIFQLKHLTNKQ